MTAPLLYITGTNTGVGKTTLATLLLARAREVNLRIAAMKPFCSGGREDAEKLHALQTAGLTIDEVNPFHFAEPLAPYIAARNENRVITAAQPIESIQKIRARNFPMMIEGAGGLMSPLGDRFTLLEIIQAIPGKICVVAPNVLGVINSAMLTHHSLQNSQSTDVLFVLMDAEQPDASAATNAEVIANWTGVRTINFPFLPASQTSNSAAAVDPILGWWLGKDFQKAHNASSPSP